MVPSLRALLDGIIDYAGLFPPARLPLEEAVWNYLRYRRSSENWMLARFVCPVARLEELTPFLAEQFPAGPPLSVSALSRGGTTFTEFWKNLEVDQDAIQVFQGLHGKRAAVDGFEVRLPEEISDPNPLVTWAGSMTAVAAGFRVRALSSIASSYEIGLGAEWRDSVLAAMTGAVESRAGFKLRCGGLVASAFPTSEQVAFVITACRDAGMPLKFTAGLHHPLRHFDPGLRVTMHGFINVFVAGILAHARGLDQTDVVRIIEDEDPASFAFDDQGIRWRDFRATTAEITANRRFAITTFGSCSFDEPRDDLRALGWL